MMKNNYNLSEHDYVLTFGMFYYSFNNDISSLTDFYKKFQFVFDFEKVKNYLIEKLPNLPLQVKRRHRNLWNK